jgi:cyclase
MLAKRIIPCLDVKDGRVVKGINFLQLRDAGNPVELAQRYNIDGADELVFLDITASYERRETLKNLVRAVATEIEIPFTVGGGIRNVDDVQTILRNGADKIAINTAAVETPEIIRKIAEIFGANIEAGKNVVETDYGLCWFEVYTYGGRRPTGIDAIKWASTVAKLGAGELLVTSMDRDGTKNGYDNILNSTISTKVKVPLVASGGAGKPIHFLDAFTDGKADAALAASVFHYNSYPVPVIKKYLREKGVNVRI